MIDLLRFLITIIIAFLVGKLVAKIKLPSILGWLITGMLLGPHALSLMSQEILDSKWYEILIPILECTVGLMIGTEIVWKKIKKSGKAIIITTLTQSLGTFVIVSLIFGIVLKIMNLPIYLAFIFGGIALATAPAPALSIVREFKTKGPVTNTLIPMAALDDIIGCIVFFTTIAIDKACIDLVENSNDEGKEHLLERINSRHGKHTIDAAAELGFGMKEYELINVR